MTGERFLGLDLYLSGEKTIMPSGPGSQSSKQFTLIFNIKEEKFPNGFLKFKNVSTNLIRTHFKYFQLERNKFMDKKPFQP